MKRKYLMILCIVFVVIILSILFLKMNKVTYIIQVSLVDDRSPDRILTVYNNKNEEVKVKRIEYLDGTILCKGYNLTAHFGDIKDEKELIIVLSDNKKVKAKIVEKEVKNNES